MTRTKPRPQRRAPGLLKPRLLKPSPLKPRPPTPGLLTPGARHAGAATLLLGLCVTAALPSRARAQAAEPANTVVAQANAPTDAPGPNALVRPTPGPAAGGTLPPGAIQEEINPRVIPGLVKPVQTQATEDGPLAGVRDTLANAGISVHALFLDFFEANPSGGIATGNTSNTGYLILGADADTDRILGLKGGTLHFEETIFPFRQNSDMASQIGDSIVGFQPAYTVIANQLSVLTYEQKLANDRLDIEAGRSNPFKYFALPVCQSINSCFSSILQNNAGFPSPQYSVWSARAAYNITPASYVQVGAFEVNPTVHTRYGYNFPADGATGEVTLVEIGHKTDFSTTAYPGRYSLTGFYNTAQHADASQTRFGRNKALYPGDPAKMVNGTSGIVAEGQQIVWRADGGTTNDKAPMSVAVYGNVSLGLDSTTALRSSVFAGATLQSPFAGRPADRFGVKVNWERLNQREGDFETAASAVSGGNGGTVPLNSYIFELNAHVQVVSAIAFEPVVQYLVHPNDFYNPYTPNRAKDGFYVGGTLIVPIGVMLGLAKL